MRTQTISRRALRFRAIFISFLVLANAACQSRSVPPAPTSPKFNQVPETTKKVAEQWLGKWNGPEGTFLEIAKIMQGYQITIRNLDGPRTFVGTPVPQGLTFARDGKTETIRAGNGEDTSMKWLLDKKNCLVIASGEGYCRD